MKRNDAHRFSITYIPYLCVACVVIMTLWLNAIYRAHGHWAQAEELHKQGELMRAARHYQWAARSYYPGSQIGEKSIDKLWSLATSFQELDQSDQGLLCLDLMRGALWSTRWLMKPYESWTDRVDQALIEQRSKGLSKEKLALALQYDPLPSVVQSLCLLLSMIAFLISVHHLFRKGITEDLQCTSEFTWAVTAVFTTLLCIFLTLAV